MTENKRFRIINDCGDYHLLDGDNKLGYDLCSPSMYKENYKNILECLNALHEEKEELIDALNQRTEQCDKLYEENQELKEAMKRLMVDMMTGGR